MSNVIGENRKFSLAELSSDYSSARCWNNFRNSNADLEISFDGEKAHDKDFSGFNFDNAWFRNSTLKNVRLSGASLDGARFDGATIEKCNLKKAKCRGMNLKNAEVLESNLSEVDLLCADVSEAKFSDVDLSGANLDGVNMKNTKFEKIFFNSKTSIYGSSIDSGTVFSKTSLRQVGISFYHLQRLERNAKRSEIDSSSYCKFLKTIIKSVALLFDYSVNLKRVILLFFVFSCIFALLYMWLYTYSGNVFSSAFPAKPEIWWQWPLLFLQFLGLSISTMVTFGFGAVRFEMLPCEPFVSVLGAFLIILNVLCGWWLLLQLASTASFYFQCWEPAKHNSDKRKISYP